MEKTLSVQGPGLFGGSQGGIASPSAFSTRNGAALTIKVDGKTLFNQKGSQTFPLDFPSGCPSVPSQPIENVSATHCEIFIERIMPFEDKGESGYAMRLSFIVRVKPWLLDRPKYGTSILCPPIPFMGADCFTNGLPMNRF